MIKTLKYKLSSRYSPYECQIEYSTTIHRVGEHYALSWAQSDGLFEKVLNFELGLGLL